MAFHSLSDYLPRFWLTNATFSINHLQSCE